MVLEATPTMGAEDFSFFGYAGVPASFAFLGSGNAAAGAVHGLHTPQARLQRLLCQPHAGSAAFKPLAPCVLQCTVTAFATFAFLNSGNAAAALQAACLCVNFYMHVCLNAKVWLSGILHMN